MHHDRRHSARRAALSAVALLLALAPLAACQSIDDGTPSPAPTTATTSPTSDDEANPSPTQGTVPDLTGISVADARNQLADLDYGMAFTDDSEIGDDSLKVTAQSPAPGSPLTTGVTVTLTVPGR
ncbi:PASTA domain-containing protein [Streptomyces sp. NPDC087903]|uniref:PASTA domain-containing protein n=1 Tax=Streptomyces sp. NPDC087903 TaxID=3365819 RepID=UPI00381A9470